ncbi:MAG: selenium-dependent molybdenum cofactor biosynthesis protein YqeB [Candidatus Neomarinimicrobiota bacterium]
MFSDTIIVIRGAGELASAAASSLQHCGFPVILTELPVPLAIRRTVTFSDAMLSGTATVEGLRAEYCQPAGIGAIRNRGALPLITDDPAIIASLRPWILVDARMQKQQQADFAVGKAYTVGLGPGFTAGTNCHAVIETKRGHDLGRIIYEGSAAPDTGIPGDLGGETVRRLLRAREAGRLEWRVDFGNLVGAGELLGTINYNHRIEAPIAGVIRGLISPQVSITKGLKIGDIDPRGKAVDVHRISDKSRAVGRAVLEAVLEYVNFTRS